MGDKATTPGHHDLLEAGTTGVTARFTAASAIGAIGDRRSIDPLIEVLEDPEQPTQLRAAAIIALGGVGDPGLLPWHAVITRALPAAAMVPTLSNGVDGLLDLR